MLSDKIKQPTTISVTFYSSLDARRCWKDSTSKFKSNFSRMPWKPSRSKIFISFLVVRMVCSDADPIKEPLLPVQSQVESRLQTCRFLNGKDQAAQRRRLRNKRHAVQLSLTQESSGSWPRVSCSETEGREHAKTAYGNDELTAALGNVSCNSLLSM